MYIKLACLMLMFFICGTVYIAADKLSEAKKTLKTEQRKNNRYQADIAELKKLYFSDIKDGVNNAS